jgi:CubicO group peptidase (beta-lactamase class C family)
MIRPSRAIFTVALLGGTFVSLPHRIHTKQDAARISTADDLGPRVDQAIKNSGGSDFAGAVVLSLDGRILLDAAYGEANRERGTKFTPETLAQVGSITKQFTAAAILDLEAQKLLQLSDSVSQFLPELKGTAAGNVTLSELLTHTAGYPEYCGDDFDHVSLVKLIEGCFKPLRISEGKFAYSNAGYSALAAVVERASGQTLETYLSRRLFEPHGMHDTGYLFPTVGRDRFATGYLKGADQGVISQRISGLAPDYWNLKGNGGMQSNTGDMYRWFQYEQTTGVLSEAFSARLRKDMVSTGESKGKVYYAYGWNVVTRTDGSIERISHTGSDGTFFSLFRWYPREKIFIYFVGSTGEEQVRKVLGAALKALEMNVAKE